MRTEPIHFLTGEHRFNKFHAGGVPPALGMSPMADIRVVRLRRDHRDLCSADPAHSTVAAVAHRWGFTHLGRFAAAHKTTYGQI